MHIWPDLEIRLHGLLDKVLPPTLQDSELAVTLLLNGDCASRQGSVRMYLQPVAPVQACLTRTIMHVLQSLLAMAAATFGRQLDRLAQSSSCSSPCVWDCWVRTFRAVRSREPLDLPYPRTKGFLDNST